jgi:amidase
VTRPGGPGPVGRPPGGARTVHVGSQHWSRDYDAGLPAVARVGPDAVVGVDLHCCSQGAVDRDVSTTPERFYQDLAYTPGMPVTGPIDVAGAEVGDTLWVEVLALEVAPRAWTMALKDRGMLGARISSGESRLLPIEGGELVFGGSVRIPIRPMIGSIGTAPAGPPVRAGKPGPHGGNMDCRLIGAGSSVLLPVLVPGAHLALGDLHAVMGDGEVGCAGAEVAGKARLRLRLLRALDLPLPFVITEETAVTVFSAETLDEAAAGAVDRMAAFLTTHAGLSLPDAAMLLSLAGDLRVCQAVNALRTCRMEVGRRVLEQLGLDLAARLESYEVRTLAEGGAAPGTAARPTPDRSQPGRTGPGTRAFEEEGP